MEPVPFAIVGLDRHIDPLLACLARSDRLRLCAVCETRPSVLNKYRSLCDDQGVQMYGDPRELLLRARPRVLLYWKECGGDDFLYSAMEKQCCLVLRPPLPGGLAAARKIIKQAERHNAAVFVWSPWLFVPCYESVRDWLAGQEIRAFSCRSTNTMLDLELPTQETMLNAGSYSALFLTQQWLGLPEQVYCRQLFRPAQTTERVIQYFGLIQLVYPECLGTITLAVNAGPSEDQLLVTSNAGQVRADPTEAHLFDCTGNSVASSHRYEAAEARQIAYSRHFDAIWQSVIEAQRSTEFELKRHLGVLAILEAAALSARTGHPEHLAKTVNALPT